VTGTTGSVVPSWLPFDYVYQRLRDRLEGLTDDELRWEPAPGAFEGEPVVALVVHILDELVHHAAEVALLRDLYAAEVQSRSE
jgi:hypothetical protein